jgi:hypothetical protein
MLNHNRPIEILRQVATGDLAIQATELGHGNYQLITGKTLEGETFWFRFFIDSYAIDYVEEFTIGGDELDYEELRSNGAEPIGLLGDLTDRLTDVVASSQVEDSDELWERWRGRLNHLGTIEKC